MKRKPEHAAPRETSLDPPVRAYLERHGYTVRSEVLGCDLVATKDSELVVVELKRRLGIDLLLQATQRQRITDSVYVAVPRDALPRQPKRRRALEHLLRRLELGLLLVAGRGRAARVELAFHPAPFDRKKRASARRAVIAEVAGRSADFNTGGATRRKIVTAYREQALFIACCLDRYGPLSPKALRALGAGPRTRAIVYDDVYGWFDRIGRACYALRDAGRAALEDYPELTRAIRAQLDTPDKPGEDSTAT